MKKLGMILLALSIMLGDATTIFAAEKVTTSIPYEEIHYQVNLCDVDVFVIDNETIVIEPEENLFLFEKCEVESEIALLNTTLENDSYMMAQLIEDMQGEEELEAVSVTIAPVEYVEDHYERVLATNTNARGYAGTDGEITGKEYLCMYTTVKKPATSNSNGTFDYTVITHGWWATTSFLGGSSYPDAGEDFLLQAAPSDWARKTSSFESTYDDDSEGRNGKEYWQNDGDTNYIEYALVDDPFGWKQLKTFELECSWAAYASNSYRMINCYYVHTWKQLSIDVSTNISGKDGVTLNIDPSLEDKSWTLYNSVTFDF